jgi:hypothetical protein
MKLLSQIISEKMSKLIPMVLLASILAISFSFVTSPNAFASQVWESSIAKFMYPDNWNIVKIIGNGEGISLQPINEPYVVLHYRVLQDSANGFGVIVENTKQFTMNKGFQIDEIIQNVPGEYIFTTSGFNNGIDFIGLVHIVQISNTNDVLVTEYIGESSKYQQYNDRSGFFIYTYLSPQEVLNQYRMDPNFQLPSADAEPCIEWDIYPDVEEDYCPNY